MITTVKNCTKIENVRRPVTGSVEQPQRYDHTKTKAYQAKVNNLKRVLGL